LLQQRKSDGYIRDCHGDLHLNNILLLDNEPLLFDCIEFNPSLRIIDVISEIAFLMMDLEHRGRADLANLLLNRYLERTGDYGALPLMPLYLGYRAMVRAKVAVLRLGQQGVDEDERQAALHEFGSYLELAEGYARAGRPQLLLTHGLSGSGKTTLTAPLLAEPWLVRIRSDIERKRLFGLKPLASSHSPAGGNIYTPEAGRRTYERLYELAAAALQGGYRVIVDATFLQREQRDRFRRLATTHHIPFTLLDFRADEALLRQRVSQRQAQGGDASEADTDVLQRQLASFQPLAEEELAQALIIDAASENGTALVHELLHAEMP
jgi:predicted kinase